MSAPGQDGGTPGGFTKTPQSQSQVPEEPPVRDFKLREASVLPARRAIGQPEWFWLPPNI